MTLKVPFDAYLALILLTLSPSLHAQQTDSPAPRTYCNPMDLDYAYGDARDTSIAPHRSTADPVIVRGGTRYYLFSTNQQGYWWSTDLGRWHFVLRHFKKNASGDDVCAPAAMADGDTLLVLPSFTDVDTMPLYRGTDPIGNVWETAVDVFPIAAWDPSLFRDVDGRLYLYWGSSNVYPIKGVELDPRNGYRPVGEVRELLLLHPEQNGWERFGENNTDTLTKPYIEGAWMTKHDGKYYLQYAAPGTEWNVYADGVYVGEGPLGPFVMQPHNPFSYKPGGFITGAGHGSTFTDTFGNYWHVATGLSWIKHKFERRNCLFPAGFDDDGILYTNTAFGDYPQFLPDGPADHRAGRFTGWMLLSYRKEATSSSMLPERPASMGTDENIRTYWSAASGDSGEWFSVDLGGPCTVNAFQVNYADEGARFYGKQLGISHRYQVFYSDDARRWTLLLDKSRSTEDTPHDYTELERPVRTRHLKIMNIQVPTGRFALSGFRIFGKGSSAPPPAVQGFTAERDQHDRRQATLRWQSAPRAYAYNIYFGVEPDKLYNCMMVYGATEYLMRGLMVDREYYWGIEAVGEGGVGKRE